MSALPVDPERLRREFPALTEDDLEAYVKVTTRILEAPAKDRGRLTREVVDGGRRAREKAAEAGAPLSAQEVLWSRYLSAVDKMQRSTVRR